MVLIFVLKLSIEKYQWC